MNRSWKWEEKINNADLIMICMNRNYAFELNKGEFFIVSETSIRTDHTECSKIQNLSGKMMYRVSLMEK